MCQPHTTQLWGERPLVLSCLDVNAGECDSCLVNDLVPARVSVADSSCDEDFEVFGPASSSLPATGAQAHMLVHMLVFRGQLQRMLRHGSECCTHTACGGARKTNAVRGVLCDGPPVATLSLVELLVFLLTADTCEQGRDTPPSCHFSSSMASRAVRHMPVTERLKCACRHERPCRCI